MHRLVLPAKQLLLPHFPGEIRPLARQARELKPNTQSILDSVSLLEIANLVWRQTGKYYLKKRGR